MSTDRPVLREHGNAYNIFILVLTVFSLAVMVVLVLPIDQATRDLLTFYDLAICVIFLADFLYNLAGAKPKRAYFVDRRGWLDLLGSMPSLPGFPYTSILRLARLARLARIARLLSGKNRRTLIADVLQNRSQYATFITILAAGMVLVTASVLVLQFESAAGDEANIRNGGDALWWSIVTITTVGYGDHFPVTLFGRLTAVSLMIVGLGIIGALASILASLLVAPSPSEKAATEAAAAPEAAASPVGPAASPPFAAAVPAPPAATVPGPAATVPGPAATVPGPAPVADPVAAELARLREEIAELRAALRSPG